MLCLYQISMFLLGHLHFFLNFFFTFVKNLLLETNVYKIISSVQPAGSKKGTNLLKIWCALIHLKVKTNENGGGFVFFIQLRCQHGKQKKFKKSRKKIIAPSGPLGQTSGVPYLGSGGISKNASMMLFDFPPDRPSDFFWVRQLGLTVTNLRAPV